MEGIIKAKTDNTTSKMLKPLFPFLFAKPLMQSTNPGRKADAIAFMLNKSPTRAKRKPFIKFLKRKKYGIAPSAKKPQVLINLRLKARYTLKITCRK
jgi:hypothetical protein